MTTPAAMKVGSLFAGYGGLDLAVEQVLDAELAWVSEIEEAPSRILAHHWPDVPNLGDITAVDWADVDPVDIITAGYPCQPFSNAGQRKGTEDERYLWPEVERAIRGLGPGLVVLENVAAHVNRGFSDVLGSLASVGYDARWTCLRAADVGAPHGRDRLFVVAWPADTDDLGQQWRRGTRRRRQGSADGGVPTADSQRNGHEQARRPATGEAAPTWPLDTIDGRDGGGSTADASSDGRYQGRPEPTRHFGGSDAAERGAAAADADRDTLREQPVPLTRGGGEAEPGQSRAEAVADADRDGLESVGRFGGVGRDADGRDGAREAAADAEGIRHGHAGQEGRRGLPTSPVGGDPAAVQWGPYGPAIHRWERTLGRVAPSPTEPGRNGQPRLSPRFVEWMQGLPDGWVTGVPGISRNDQLKVLGNGVVPQQASEAVRRLLPALEEVAA